MSRKSVSGKSLFELLKSPFASRILPTHISITGPMRVAIVFVLSWLAMTASAGSGKFYVPRLAQETSIASHQMANDKEVRPLEAGKPVERELGGADTHRYAVSVSAG